MRLATLPVWNTESKRLRKPLQKHSGSCRDSALLLVECFRSLGIAARFVSGYLIQLAVEKPSVSRFKLGSASRLCRPACVGGGFPAGCRMDWIRPHLGFLVGEGHIPAGSVLQVLRQAAPISGTGCRAGQHRVQLRNVCSPLETNRDRGLRGISEEKWLRIRHVAHCVDKELEAQDVRLTMGGEPTFAGIDEPESPQWNIDALGDDKRTRGGLALDSGSSRQKWLLAGFFITVRGNGIRVSAIASLGAGAASGG